MPQSALPPDDAYEIEATIRRVERLERRTRPVATQRYAPIVFSYPGTLVVDTESPPYFAVSAITITQVRVSLLTAAAGNNVVALRVNGATVQSFTLTAGQTSVAYNVTINPGPGYPITVKATTVSGANLSVIIRATYR